MKTVTALLILFFLSNYIAAQNEYPLQIPANTSQTITAGEKDLWVISDNQFDSCSAKALKLMICDSINILMKQKTEKLQKINSNLSIINDTLQKAYMHYTDKWKSCDVNLEKTEKKLAKQKRLKYIFGGSGFAAGVILALLLF